MLHIRQFQLDKIQNGSVVAVHGARGSGKTTIIKQILKHEQLRQKNAKLKQQLEIIKHNLRCLLIQDLALIVSGYCDIEIEPLENAILRTQNNSRDELQPLFKSLSNPNLDMLCEQEARQNLLVCVSDGNSDITIHRELWTMIQRRLSATIIYDVQHAMDLHRNFNYLFITRCTLPHIVGALYKKLNHIFPNFATFYACLQQCTHNHNVMVIDNVQRLNGIANSVFWYNANL